MNLEELFDVVDHLPDNELARLKAHISEREKPNITEGEIWGAALEAAAQDFRGNSSPEELNEIFVAMNEKSHPSEKGL